VADARQEEEAYRSLGFEPVVLDGDDALARLLVRLAEVDRSLDLVARAGSVSTPEVALDGTASGTGAVAVETPRGTARLRATLEEGALTGVELDTPSTRHLELVEYVAEQREFADALVGAASLDISPWEVVR
jgi:Ni,Fe-hydrogenase III large subunit